MCDQYDGLSLPDDRPSYIIAVCEAVMSRYVHRCHQ